MHESVNDGVNLNTTTNATPTSRLVYSQSSVTKLSDSPSDDDSDSDAEIPALLPRDRVDNEDDSSIPRDSSDDSDSDIDILELLSRNHVDSDCDNDEEITLDYSVYEDNSDDDIPTLVNKAPEGKSNNKKLNDQVRYQVTYQRGNT